jgi:hypothetical protein
MVRFLIFVILVFMFGYVASCRNAEVNNQNVQQKVAMPTPTPAPLSSPTPSMPNLQAELTDTKNTTTNAQIGKFDFKNFTYELPRGWQNPDGTTEIELKNGRVEPLEANTNIKEKGNENGDSASLRRIGLTIVSTKFFDVTGDGNDDAIVILKIETGGSAVPQLVYVFEWKSGRPELIWPFRTGDRADGGLKNVFAENGELVVELYGQDRYLLGQIETRRIDGDLEQLCCPTHFTRTRYKWNGKNFLMQGKRLTYSIANPALAPIENMGDAAQKKYTKR